MPGRLQVIWLHFRLAGDEGLMASPVTLYAALGGGEQHYSQNVRKLVERHYLIPTGETQQYRGRTLNAYRACRPDEYPGVLPFKE